MSLPEKDVAFIDRQVADHGDASRSAVIRKAINRLRTAQLADDYIAAFKEWEESGEEEIWDRAAGDGLDDEPW